MAAWEFRPGAEVEFEGRTAKAEGIHIKDLDRLCVCGNLRTRTDEAEGSVPGQHYGQ